MHRCCCTSELLELTITRYHFCNCCHDDVMHTCCFMFSPLMGEQATLPVPSTNDSPHSLTKKLLQSIDAITKDSAFLCPCTCNFHQMWACIIHASDCYQNKNRTWTVSMCLLPASECQHMLVLQGLEPLTPLVSPFSPYQNPPFRAFP